MGTEQATLETFGEVSEFERLTGVRGTRLRQREDGDRVSEEEAPEIEDGLEDALSGDVEVRY